MESAFTAKVFSRGFSVIERITGWVVTKTKSWCVMMMRNHLHNLLERTYSIFIRRLKNNVPTVGAHCLPQISVFMDLIKPRLGSDAARRSR